MYNCISAWLVIFSVLKWMVYIPPMEQGDYIQCRPLDHPLGQDGWQITHGNDQLSFTFTAEFPTNLSKWKVIVVVEDWNRKRFHELHTALRAGGISERKLQLVYCSGQTFQHPQPVNLSRANTQRLFGGWAGDSRLRLFKWLCYYVEQCDA
jgi:hypothetical protein